MASKETSEALHGIEQQIQALLKGFMFSPNEAATWAAVTGAVSTHLNGLWKQGGLAGATASEAFSVVCGLGSTMTPQVILDGNMIVHVRLRISHSADVTELSFTQAMGAGS